MMTPWTQRQLHQSPCQEFHHRPPGPHYQKKILAYMAVAVAAEDAVASVIAFVDLARRK